MNHNREVNSLQKIKLYYEKLEEPNFMRGVMQRIRRKREATLKRKQERENTKGKKK